MWRNRPSSFAPQDSATYDLMSFYGGGGRRDKRPGGGNWRNRAKYFDYSRYKRPGGGLWRNRARFADLHRMDKRPGGGVWRNSNRANSIVLAKRPGAGKMRRHHLCLPRDHSCSSSPGAFWKCCGGHVCRCNIFGSNCRCSRPGFTSLFGK